MGLLDLTGLLAQTQLEELLAGLAELGGDLGGREGADFFGGHGDECGLKVITSNGGAIASDEAAVEGQFGVGEAESLFGDGDGNTGEFEEHGAGFDHGDVVFDRTFTLTHTHFLRLFGDGLVREYADPEFTFALEVARDGDASGFNLLTGHGTTGQGLEAEFAESKSVAALGIASAGAFHHFAEFGAGGC
jgi:hypothetical protein